MKKSSDYVGQFLVAKDSSLLVLISKKENQNPAYCHYVSPDFNKIRKHSKCEFNNLNSKVEWIWAVNTWGKEAVQMKDEEIQRVLDAIQNRVHDKSFGLNVELKNKEAKNSLSDNQSLVAMRASLEANTSQ